jgi:hypothetical protein
MRIDAGEFRSRPLRVYALLGDVPLRDAWAIPLRGGGAGRTIRDFVPLLLTGLRTTPLVVRGLCACGSSGGAAG